MRIFGCVCIILDGISEKSNFHFHFTSILIKFGTFAGCEITENYAKLFQAFRREAENLSERLALTFTGYPVGNPCKKIGFPTEFLGVPDTRKLSNFAPCLWSEISAFAVILADSASNTL